MKTLLHHGTFGREVEGLSIYQTRDKPNVVDSSDRLPLS